MNRTTSMLNLPVLLLCLSGFSGGLGGISIIYGVAMALAVVMLIAYTIPRRKKDIWYVLLFCGILTVNAGYFLLSVSKSEVFALWANRLSYLGSVFLPMSMLMIVFKATRIKCKKWLTVALLILASLVFLLAATPGVLPLYYKEVELVIAEGVSTLKKTYGPLHFVYMCYLVGYFSAMIAVIIYAYSKKRIDSPLHAVALTAAVFVNLGVWAIEQAVKLDIEMLSLSYIISELFLLLLDWLMWEQERLKAQLTAKPAPVPVQTVAVSREVLNRFREGMNTLTQTETAIFNHYTDGHSTKTIMEQMCITENTLKFHNKNIYSKLGINSRKQLLELHRQLTESKKS